MGGENGEGAAHEEEGDRVQGLVGDDGYRASMKVSREEGSMARDRTVQQQLQPSPHTRIRSRQGQQVPPAPDLTNAAYLTFQVQGQESAW
jgi:hypothetical protein